MLWSFRRTPNFHYLLFCEHLQRALEDKERETQEDLDNQSEYREMNEYKEEIEEESRLRESLVYINCKKSYGQILNK